MLGISAGEPGHPPKGGRCRVCCLLHPQPQALPADRDHASGRPGARPFGPGCRLRTDLPGYRVYRHGQLVEKRGEIRELWRDDLVAFLLGCSLTFEHALIEAGVGVRNVELGTLVPMLLAEYPGLTHEDALATIAYGAEAAREQIIPIPTEM